MNTIFKTLMKALFNNWTVITKKTYLQPVKVPVANAGWEKRQLF
ncbi:MAG: hypothetical protein U0V75_05660 [Ferruginibacter sp.]